MERWSPTPPGMSRRNPAPVVRPYACITAPAGGLVFDRDVAMAVRDCTTLRIEMHRPEAESRYPVQLCAEPCGTADIPAGTGGKEHLQ